MFRIAAALLAAAGLAACQSFQSRHVDLGADEIATGLHYAVPKALMTVELRQEQGKLWLGVSRPFLVGDPQATYTLSASSGLFANQRYKLRVDPQTRLLDYINAVSQGQATQILTNLAQAAGAGQGLGDFKENNLGDNVPVQVFSKVFDPLGEGCDFAKGCELTQLSNELHLKAREFLRCDDGSGPNLIRCRELGAANTTFKISIAPMFEVQAGPSSARRASAATACAASICYRAPAPYLMRVYVKGSRDVSEIVMLPNQSPIMALDLPAGVFATSRSRVNLVYGMPARVEIDQGNELVGVTAIPLTIVKGFFDAVGSVFQLRVNYNSQYEKMLDSDLSRRDAQDAYNDARDARDAARTPADATEASAEDTSVAPENSMTEYLDDDAEVIDAVRLSSITTVNEPADMLFTVPLEPDQIGSAAASAPVGVLDGASPLGAPDGSKPQ
jgi:hypothetical protein